jgi:Fe(3+) dicitrate transport protein
LVFPADRSTLTVQVIDASGAAVAGAAVEARPSAARASVRGLTDVAGEFQIELPAGACDISVAKGGFAAWREEIALSPGASSKQVTLQPAALAQEILVSGGLIAGTPEVMSRMPGSIDVLDPRTLQESRVFGFEEALRKATGVHARPEEGFSLRPNIGIRGINPTRSSKILLLEDGIPLSYAPYGDNASYYHPPVDRFESVEIVKGSGQIAYGPMTVGGVVNYVTPAIPDRPAGRVSLTGGTRDYLNGHFQYGGTFKGTGLLFDAVRKQGEGARDNVRSGLTDFNFKALRSLGSRHALAFKFNSYTEDSRVTYSGLRLDEWNLSGARWNPFRNDHFYGDRIGASATHTMSVTSSLILTTNIYGARFSRDWWRQSSNSSQRPNDRTDPKCAGMANLNTTCGNEGRLRDYSTWGFDPRIRWYGSLLGVRSELDAGGRAHFEEQERIQKNGDLPTSRDGLVVENNQRLARAFSGYVQNRFFLGKFTITPGLRLENIRFQRTNRLANGGAGATGETNLTQAIPGLGLSWNPKPWLTVFAGAHRGFAPPRVEDMINNSGGFVDLGSELSWNYEAGFRARVQRNFSLDATFFRLDYSNQIVPASLSGGVGAVLTNGGATLHQGLETSGRYDVRNRLGSWYLRGAYTWVPVSSFEGTRYSSVAGFGQTLITGNRIPYAPEHLLTASLSYTHRTGVQLLFEALQTGRQFGDDLNTVNSTPDGQRGAIPGNVIWNATMNVPLEAWRTVAFVTVKNLGDRLILVDRSRGMLPGSPRLIQVGLSWSF